MQPPGSEERPIIFSLHGIRTRAAWQKDLTRVLSEAGFNHLPLDFGFFRAVRLLMPASRRRQVDWFRDCYTTEMRGRSSPPSVIAHSFGTYIVAEAIRKYPEVRFRQIILCGSIVHRDFPWSERTDAGQVGRVLNECGQKDFWSRIVVWFVRDAGSSGVKGFSDTAGNRVIQRLHPDWRHSTSFYELNYQHNWVSFLKGNLPGPPGTAEGRTINWYFRFTLVLCLVGVLCMVFFIQRIRLGAGIKHPPSLPALSPQPSATPATVNVPSATPATVNVIPPKECSQQRSSEQQLPTGNELLLTINIIGQWLSCSTIKLWETPESEDQVGIEFTREGRWFMLFRDASGRVLRGSGFDYEGTVHLMVEKS